MSDWLSRGGSSFVYAIDEAAGSLSAPAPSVRLKDVSKKFGEVSAVDDISLDIGRGEFFTLLGPSGCGKTTTLRMIAGFEDPTAGTIFLDSVDVAGLPAFKRPTNTVFQSYALFPHMTVEENVAFGPKRQKVPKAEIKKRVRAELERVGLLAQAQRKPRQLSGGQQQRVALARALVNLPTVLLLDEPLGALDLALRRGLQVELKRIQREVGITFIYVTHDQEEALTMSDRIAVMNLGRVEQIGSPEEIYERPRTSFVAGFIGVSNLMPAKVVAVDGSVVSIDLDLGATVRTKGEGFRVGERCNAVVRPERLTVVAEGKDLAASQIGIPGLLESSVYLGSSSSCVVRLADGTTLVAHVPNTAEQGHHGIPPVGSPLRLMWAPEDMHLVKESNEQESPSAVEDHL